MAKQVEQQDQPVSLDRRQADARARAQQARLHLDAIEARITAAVAERRFHDAHEAKMELPAAERAWGEAEAEARALESVLADLAQQQAQREAALVAERRRQQATDTLNRAAEREAEGMDQLAAIRAEIIAGIEAVRDTIMRGYQIESLVKQARTDVARARVDLGQAEGMPHIVSGPNAVSAYVERSQALTAIRHGQALPD